MASDQERIVALERQVKALQQQFQPISTFFYQKGPMPGALNAVRIGQGPAAKAAMWINMDGNSPGAAPILWVTDASGQIRAELGFLAAITGSTQQYGFRTRRADGTVGFDSGGARIPRLGTTGAFSGTFAIPTTTTTIQSVNYTVVANQTVLVLGVVHGYYSHTASGFQDGIGLEPSNPSQWTGGSTLPSPDVVFNSQPGTSDVIVYQSGTLWAVQTLATGGTYTAAWMHAGGAAVGNLIVQTGQVDVFLIGG